MKSFNFKELAANIVCYLFAVLYIYAAASKWFDYENFRVQLGQSPLLSAFAGPVSWGVPALEILISHIFSRSGDGSRFGLFNRNGNWNARLVPIKGNVINKRGYFVQVP